MAPRLLVLRALGLGDLLTAVPALHALRRAFPDHRLVLAAPGALSDVVAAVGAVDALLPASAPGRAVPERLAWRGPPPEVAVDLHGRDTHSLRPLLALRPGRVIGYARPPAPAWREREHERARWCRLLRAHGVPADPARVGVAPPAVPSPAPGAVVVHPGADAGARRWPAERFATVARTLAGDHRVVVTAGPGEERLGRRVAALAGLPRAAVLTGLPLAALSALVADARAVLVGDTGVAHLATAHGTPSVVLFGPVAPELWGPPPSFRHRALWHPGPDDGPRPGDPHLAAPDARLLRITVPEVLAAFDRVTAGAAPGDGGQPT
ncbi:ADP-heptose:LPS heptosyltransferase [Streptomyces zhaozhouensis]|uniref:ADP-heptose:LPS heptosyltransferase n=1 Tax=Streptomyces zhaozhouensis TaxID=1300267 RepID=A0A286DSK0_9ACTN|nr:glycosyltransferase family 9 protein [Streptomyces zhaozhouensis]SOD61629.1 ADP-heptose:LPS heptosyltransferase [Streptomyces zhaozhouensis]